MAQFSLYVVDDDPAVREGIILALEADYQVQGCADATAAMEAVQRQVPDLVLLDIGLPDLDGLELLKRIRTFSSDPLVIIITGHEDLQTVVAAMKLGAYDYVVKPLHLESLEVRIKNALNTLRLKKEVQWLQEKYLQENLPFFIGESQAMQEVMTLVKQSARSPDTPVLILGETGTGKEWIAHALHYHSPNFQGPMVTLNCAAIPQDLLESELFGYEGGAFSGARTAGKNGLVEEAAFGTLVLDEVGDLSLEAQAKLLRFLETGEYYRVGSTRQSRVKIRVVAATNKNLPQAVRQGRFRDDLFFRLGVVTIAVPTLNQRREDILLLARHFLVEFAEKFGKTFTGIAPEAEWALLNHHWEGNVRELKNLLERGVLLSSGPILTLEGLGLKTEGNEMADESSAAALPPLPFGGLDLGTFQTNFERHYIQEALNRAGGNESKAAALLRLNHHTFRYRRKKVLPDA